MNRDRSYQHDGGHIEELIDIALDGSASAESRAHAEHELGRDDAGSRALALQRRIDDRLLGLFDPPAAERIVSIDAGSRQGLHPASSPIALGQARGDHASGRGPGMRRAAWVAAAALLLLTLSAGSWVWWSTTRRTPSERLYTEAVKAGFRPAIACNTPEAFAAFTAERFGTPVTFEADERIAMLGWSYPSADTFFAGGDQRAIGLLATTDGQPVLLLMGLKSDDLRPGSKPDQAVRMHRRELEGLVIYELSKCCGANVAGTLKVAHSATGAPEQP